MTIGGPFSLNSTGTAITLLHSEEVHHFKELIRKTGREKLAKYRVKDDDLHPLIPEYQESLEKLQEVLKLDHQRRSQYKGHDKTLKFLQQQLKGNLTYSSVDVD